MLAPVTISTDELQAVVSQIKEIERGTGLSRTIAIGQLILNRFFDGSVQQWREKGKHKQHSIRRLAELPECPFGKSALSEAVGVYVVSLHLDGLHTAQHLKASHLAAASALPKDDCLRLLSAAECEGWSVKRLRDEVALFRMPRRAKRTTPVPDQLAGALRQLSVGIHTMLNVFEALERGKDSPRQQRIGLGELAHVRELCSALGQELARVDAQLSARTGLEPCVRMYGQKGVPRRAQSTAEGTRAIDVEQGAEPQRSTGS
jgi:hypothetical protein